MTAGLPRELQIQLDGCACGHCGALFVTVGQRRLCVVAWPAAGRPWPPRWVADPAASKIQKGVQASAAALPPSRRAADVP